MLDILQYPSAKETHGLKGSVVPKSLARSQDDDLGSTVSDDTGSAFDLYQKIPMNIIECDKNGQLKKAFVLDAEAQLRLQRANRVVGGVKPQRLMTFEEAAKVDPNADSIQMTPTSSFKRSLPAKEQEEKQAQLLMEKPKLHSAAYESKPDLFMKSELNDFDMIATHPRVKVRFKGQFGSISVLYNFVFVHDSIQLVMLQYSSDGQFNEAPSGDQLVLVQIDNCSYNCFPGPEVPLVPGSKLLMTIFFIESEVDNG